MFSDAVAKIVYMADENLPRENKDKKPQNLSSLHTLIGDTRQFLKGKNISLSALIAQSQKYEKAKEEQRFSYGFYILVGFLALFVIGGGAFWFMRGYISQPQEEPVTKRLEPLFSVYETREILVGTQAQDFITPFRGILSENTAPGRMIEVIAKNKNTEKDLSLGELFSLVGISAMPDLINSFGGRFTLGIYGTLRGSEPVIITSIKSFEKTLSVMLELEKLLPGAFLNTLPANHPIRQFEFFEDRLIANQEARILKTAGGEPLFAYAFFSRKILIIAVSEDSLSAVINNFLLIPPVL